MRQLLSSLFLAVLLTIPAMSEETQNNANLSPVEQLFHATIRIHGIKPNGKTSTGTGFFYNFRGPSAGLFVPAIVTNRHVIAEVDQGMLVFTLQKPDGSPDVGKFFQVVVSDFKSAWIGHPDPNVDLCAMPIVPIRKQFEKDDRKFFCVTLDESFIPSEEDIADMLGMDSIIMVGYPNGLWDAKNNMPILRRGVMASHYGYDWNGKREFLIDAACFPGSSGSPILICDVAGVRTKKTHVLDGTRIKFMGVLYAGPTHTAEGKLEIVTIPTGEEHRPVTRIPNNLGIAIKSAELRKLGEAVSTVAASRPAGKQ